MEVFAFSPRCSGVLETRPRQLDSSACVPRSARWPLNVHNLRQIQSVLSNDISSSDPCFEEGVRGMGGGLGRMERGLPGGF